MQTFAALRMLGALWVWPELPWLTWPALGCTARLLCASGFAALAGSLVWHVLRHRRYLAAVGGRRFPSLWWWHGAVYAVCAETMAAAVVFLPCPTEPWYVLSMLALGVVVWLTFDRTQRSNVEAETTWRRPDFPNELRDLLVTGISRHVDAVERVERLLTRVAGDEHDSG